LKSKKKYLSYKIQSLHNRSIFIGISSVWICLYLKDRSTCFSIGLILLPKIINSPMV
jgi:hypothetical protein